MTRENLENEFGNICYKMRLRKKIKNPGEKKQQQHLVGEDEWVKGHILAYLYSKRRRVSALMNDTDKASLTEAI